jgi:hypothetical protein
MTTRQSNSQRLSQAGKSCLWAAGCREIRQQQIHHACAVKKDIDAKLDKLLTAEQKSQLKQMQQGSAPVGPVLAGGPGRGGPPPGGPPVFRAYRYGRQFPGLAGKNLTPGKTIEELQQKRTNEAAALERVLSQGEATEPVLADLQRDLEDEAAQRNRRHQGAADAGGSV